MNRSEIKLKRKALSKNGQTQFFKEMPSTDKSETGNVDRINAHDLFSLYTADIIKEDTVFFR